MNILRCGNRCCYISLTPEPTKRIYFHGACINNIALSDREQILSGKGISRRLVKVQNIADNGTFILYIRLGKGMISLPFVQIILYSKRPFSAAHASRNIKLNRSSTVVYTNVLIYGILH